MPRSSDLRSEYCNLCRILEMLLHDTTMIEWLTISFGDASGHNISFAQMTKCKISAINSLATRIILPIIKEDLKTSLSTSVDKVYETCAVSARQFGRQLVGLNSSEIQKLFLEKSQEEFVKMRLLLDKQMRSLLGTFFDETMWNSEGISVPMLFRIDIDRKSRSYQDEVNQGLVK